MCLPSCQPLQVQTQHDNHERAICKRNYTTWQRDGSSSSTCPPRINENAKSTTTKREEEQKRMGIFIRLGNN